ncbi:hypothetical protein AEP_00645 [Curvibacter sp. AEP1-3]|uniref:hypothetical protein n=1 Tax=Curvibacter sp. AEP1-3 TaxID=1844971 RepID=UPI000B3CF66E|nr:hypothetical protein [Curvibacter sp. AEP1-3]ARV17605.1 hypothetical protein AEP_00645 [Curvibacter sp. AEP1-3]
MTVTFHQFNCIEDYFADADSRAMELQANLVRDQNIALKITVVFILLLAISAYLLRTVSLQSLCPVAVFLMIQYLDRLRKSKTTFRFVSSRLTAETLRVIGAARSKPLLLDLIVSTRGLSTHLVAEESAVACGASKALLSTQSSRVAKKLGPSADFWSDWVDEQTKYYLKAGTREIVRSKKGISIFNLAFTLVALIGIGSSIWSVFDVSAVRSDAFRALMAFATLIGSCGLAYINFVKDRKAFDQSFDYDHMYKVLSGSINPRVVAQEGAVFERMVVTETLNEHLRWALRMAGHFKTVPE